MRTRTTSVLFLPSTTLLLAWLVLAAGCGDDPTASRGGEDDVARAVFQGSFDGDDFVLQQVVDPATGRRLDLVATDVRGDASTPASLEVDVALRNPTDTAVFGPMRLYLGAFVPSTVQVVNSDDSLILAPESMAPMPIDGPYPHFFVYGPAELGDDEMMLGPGETSRPRTWRFEMPVLGAFSFGSEVWMGTVPDRVMLGGRVFLDEDRDGIADDGESVPPFGPTAVVVRFPSGRVETTRTDELGRWRVPARAAGLYEVHWSPPPTMQFAPICLTTPDPLRVVLPNGADGTVVGFDQANIGVDPDPCLPPPPPDDVVRLFAGPADSVRTDFYHLVGVEVVRGDPVTPDGVPFVGLRMRIGFSGCTDEHPVELFAGSNFRETAPVSTWIRISHDDRDELCDAYFEKSFVFDLRPLVRHFLDLYPGGRTFVLQLATPDGVERRIAIEL